jgi:hypothetical protein
VIRYAPRRAGYDDHAARQADLKRLRGSNAPTRQLLAHHFFPVPLRHIGLPVGLHCPGTFGRGRRLCCVVLVPTSNNMPHRGKLLVLIGDRGTAANHPDLVLLVRIGIIDFRGRAKGSGIGSCSGRFTSCDRKETFNQPPVDLHFGIAMTACFG